MHHQSLCRPRFEIWSSIQIEGVRNISIPTTRVAGKDASGDDIRVPYLLGPRDRAIIAAMVYTLR